MLFAADLHAASLAAPLPAALWTPPALRLLAATCWQESGAQNVPQRLSDGSEGLAAGYPQMQANGIADVLLNSQSAKLARLCVEASGLEVGASGAVGLNGGYPSTEVPGVSAVVRAKFLNYPILQLQLARLMLWDDPNPLPAIDSSDANWAYYLTNWRPGKPSRERWDAQSWPQALATVPNPA